MYFALRLYYQRFKLQRALTKLLDAEQRQAQHKVQQQWHWGDTGSRELAVIAAVRNWLLPLPAAIDAVAWLNTVNAAFTTQQASLRQSDSDGYALATSKMLAGAVLAQLSLFGKNQPGFKQALGYQLLQAIAKGDRPEITYLIEAGADIDVSDGSGRNAVALATHYNQLYALVALQGETAFYTASDACWALALRQGEYRFKQLPAERISENLCDEALLGDRHNYYSLPLEYLSLSNLARRCSARPELIAQLPAEVAFNPEFYQQVHCQTPRDYWPNYQRYEHWLAFFPAGER